MRVALDRERAPRLTKFCTESALTYDQAEIAVFRRFTWSGPK